MIDGLCSSGEKDQVATITPEDAYALALIAKSPEANGDLVETLSPEARPIGHNLVQPAACVDQEILTATEALRAWAKRNEVN